MRNLICFIAVLVASGCVYVEDGADWSPDERVDIDPFHTFTLNGSADVKIFVCDCEAAIYVDDRATDVPNSSDGHLSLHSGDEVVWASSGDVMLRTPNLRSVTLNGSGEIRIRGVHTSEFAASNNGSGTIEIEGVARRANLRVTGSGPIEAEDLQTKITTAVTVGSGDIELCAFERAEARVEGSGDIEVSCNPEDVDSSVAGSGDVEMR